MRSSLPEPYYQEPDVTLYNADMRDVLPHLPDRPYLIVTDPPYGIGLTNHDTTGNRRGSAGIDYRIAGDSDVSAANEMLRWSRLRRLPVVSFASPRKPLEDDWKQTLIWSKGKAVGAGGDPETLFMFDYELIHMVAAKRAGVPVIGCEILKANCETTVERLRQSQLFTEDS